MEEATSSEIFCLFLLTGATQVVPFLFQGPLCHACVHVGFNEEGTEQVFKIPCFLVSLIFADSALLSIFRVNCVHSRDISYFSNI